jgi:2-deoxy-D-gluconate 3-dehydrogenase
MEINFRGTYVCIQEFGRELLQENRKGKIINLASMAAYLAQTNISVYCSSKAAVQNLTRAVSNEWAGRGITCNSICPGYVLRLCLLLFNSVFCPINSS